MAWVAPWPLVLRLSVAATMRFTLTRRLEQQANRAARERDRRNVIVDSPFGGCPTWTARRRDRPKVRRHRKKTLQACPGVLCARGAQVAHPRAARGKVIYRRVWGDTAPTRKRCTWVMLAGRWIGNGTLVGLAGWSCWFGTPQIVRTSPCRVRARRAIRRLPVRAASGRGLAEVLSRPSWSVWRLLAGVLGAARCVGGRSHRAPQDERLQGHTKSQPYSDDAPRQPQALAMTHTHNRSQVPVRESQRPDWRRIGRQRWWCRADEALPEDPGQRRERWENDDRPAARTAKRPGFMSVGLLSSSQVHAPVHLTRYSSSGRARRAACA